MNMRLFTRTNVRHRAIGFSPAIGGLLVLVIIALLPSVALTARAEDSVAPDKRMTVALLSFADKTGDPKSAHWRYSLPRMVGAPLREAKSIRVYPAEACDYGLRKLKLTAGDPVDAAQATKIGEIIEARRVVRGDYRRKGKAWTVTAHVLNVATGKESAALSATAGDWFDVCDQVAGKILRELGIGPIPQTEAVRKRIRFTTSATALELYSQSYALQVERKPVAEIERCSRQAVAADPQCSAMRLGLAADLLNQGKLEEGSQEIQETLKLKPESSGVQMALGILMLFQDKPEAAGKHFREAIRLNPDDPEIHSRLALYHVTQGGWPQAVASLQEALRLNPVSAVYHAQLGRAYASQGERAKALLELANAEVLGLEDVNDEQMAFEAYEMLNELPRAVEHYEKFLILARGQGINPKLVNQIGGRLEKLKASLTSVFVNAVEPNAYSGQSLGEALSARLSAEELALVNLPLASTPEMKRWAEELTQGAQNDQEKARKLYDALVCHLDPGAGGSRTAGETFADWRKPQASFHCQEYARLYVALARDVGLKAFFVMVGRDHENRTVLHACAGVFFDGKVLLADPAYRWFGVPHQQFVFQDDYQAVVNQLNQSRDLARLRLAIKLQPDSVLSQFNLAMRLMALKQLEEAGQVLQTALKLDSESWIAQFAQGTMAWHEGQPELALTLLRKAAEMNPLYSAVQYSLARVLLDLDELHDSREAFRACLRLRPESKEEADARRAIARINEKLGPETALEAAVAAGEDADRPREGRTLTDFLGVRFACPTWSPAISDVLGVIYDDRPEPRQLEIEKLTRQAAADPRDAACRFRLGVLLGKAGRHDESTRRYKEAEEIHRERLKADPDDLPALTGLAHCLRGTEEGGRLAKRATELAPAACESWLALAQHQSRLLMIQCCEGLDDLPASGFDQSRLVEALRLRARSDPQSQAIFELGREVLASSLKAIEVAPANPEPFLRNLAMRPIVMEILDILHRLRDEPSLDWAEERRQSSGRFEQAVLLCRDSPEALGAVTMLRFLAAYALLPKNPHGCPDVELLKKRQEEVLDPALARLRELHDSPDAEIAAAACEAYSALVSFIPVFGGLPVPTSELPALLTRAVRLAPRRCLAWDLLIQYTDLHADGNMDEARAVAVERAKVLKTGRSHALIGLCSRDHQASRAGWEQAVKLEPGNVEYLLNLAAESLRGGQSRQSREAVSGLLDQAADLAYDSSHRQLYPELSTFRLRIFAVNQALAGNPEVARRTVAQILVDDPDDAHAQGLQRFLEEAK
jgi:tetratricopeptide (TPR) repeat protein